MPATTHKITIERSRSGPCGLSIAHEHKEQKMFAVIKTGGKQYRVVAEDVLLIDRVEAEPGTVIEFGEVLVVGGDQTLLGAPTVAGATVGAEVLDHVRDPKVIAFQKRHPKNSRPNRAHRPAFPLVPTTHL